MAVDLKKHIFFSFEHEKKFLIDINSGLFIDWYYMYFTAGWMTAFITAIIYQPASIENFPLIYNNIINHLC